MRLIDADELKIPSEELIAKMAIALAPTIDPVKHGRWEIHPRYIKCSECGEPFPLIPQNYCPHCGARMEGKSDGHTN